MPNDPTAAGTEASAAQRVAFHMAEFGALKSEIAELVRQTSASMTFAVTASGAIAAWLLTHPMDAEILRWARWLPVTVSALFGLFALGAYVRMADKGSYLRKVEARLALDGLGWEGAFAGRSPWIGIFQVLGWGVLNLLGLAMAIALPLPQAQPDPRPPAAVANVVS